MSKVFIIGDIHGNWPLLNQKTKQLIEKYPDEKIDLISVGDFGYWPRFNNEDYSLKKIETYNNQLKIYFCPGNHEDWWALKELDDNIGSFIPKVHKNIYYCSFGATKTFNGKRFLFCGGAESVDKNYRTLGLDWFPEETINEKDMTYLPENKKIHVIISHTSPNEVNYQLNRHLDKKIIYNNDPSAKYLNFIYSKYRPLKWYFGHWHISAQFHDRDTEFVCLNQIDSDKLNLIEFYI